MNKDIQASIRLSAAQMEFLKAEAYRLSSPKKLMKPVDVMRKLIDEAMANSQSEIKEAA